MNLIDAGGFGEVFLVQDKITNDNYALKVLSKAKVSILITPRYRVTRS